ncbi:hypothetical protein BX666DRAFT_1076278 [Dichotomocladium elegans]|nr:hypothetical protein BX666DRAFT_1076278 [Dichotomocladium elegans]
MCDLPAACSCKQRQRARLVRQPLATSGTDGIVPRLPALPTAGSLPMTPSLDSIADDPTLDFNAPTNLKQSQGSRMGKAHTGRFFAVRNVRDGVPRCDYCSQGFSRPYCLKRHVKKRQIPSMYHCL